MSVGEKTPPTSPSSSSQTSLFNNPHRIHDDISDLPPETASECGFEGGFGVISESSGARHCWSCKGEVGDADRCPSCGWIPCSCGACSPECTADVEVEGGV
jgi:hypothetical protein